VEATNISSATAASVRSRAAGSGAPVSLQEVSRSFGAVRALNGLSLEIAPGELVALLGPSGCGKTTALRILAGFETADSGTVTVDGKDVAPVPPAKRDMGMVFQSYSLFPNMSALENVGFGLRMRKMGAADRRRRAREQLELVGLAAQANQFPHQLSGGQQQRVALARALAIQPRVLLLDEPLSALDEQLRVQMRQELRRMQQELGITFIHVTHTQLEAIAIADIVVVMEKGKIKQAGPARDVYDQPRDRYVAEFLGGQNVLTGRIERIEGDSAIIVSQEMRDVVVPLGVRRTASAGDRVDFAIRRDDVDLVRPEAGGGGERAKVPSRVRAIEYQGNFVKVILDKIGDDELIAYVPDRVFYRDPFSVGDVVIAGWEKDKTRMLA